MYKRNYIYWFLFLIAIIIFQSNKINAVQDDNKSKNNNLYSLDSKKTFDRLIKKAKDNNWNKMPIGQLISTIANEFINTPYTAFTLEGEGKEICRFNLVGLDCYTLSENSLCLARIIKNEKYDINDFINELTKTRYRNGVIEDYSSRLHYTSDWIYENCKNNIFNDITKQLDGDIYTLNVSYMSNNFNQYSALKNNSDLVIKIRNFEKEINKRKCYVILKDNISKIKNKLQSGDIVAFATNRTGLDYSHIGIILLDKNGVPHLLHASSKFKKVIIGPSIDEYIKDKKSDIGITVIRAK